MKTIFYLIAACAVVFSACQNDNSVNPRPTEEIVGKATIKGKIKAQLNTTIAGLENVPDGTKVIAEISTADLVLNTQDTNYPSKYYETTVTNGEYSIEVEAGPRGSEVKLHFADFRADVITGGGTPTSTVFTAGPDYTEVIKNQVVIIDVTYND